MTCLVQECDSIEKYVTVKYLLDGREHSGQVCSKHAYIVMEREMNYTLRKDPKNG